MLAAPALNCNLGVQWISACSPPSQPKRSIRNMCQGPRPGKPGLPASHDPCLRWSLVQDQVQEVVDSLQGDLAAVEAQLVRRQELAGVRSQLELLQQLAHAASKVDKLLTEVEAAAAVSTGGECSAVKPAGFAGALDQGGQSASTFRICCLNPVFSLSFPWYVCHGPRGRCGFVYKVCGRSAGDTGSILSTPHLPPRRMSTGAADAHLPF